MDNNDGRWKEKLVALCEALQIEELDDLLANGTVDTYKQVGTIMYNIINNIINENKELRLAIFMPTKNIQ
jgi:hypothetical protein